MVIGDSGNTGVFGPIGHGGTERMIAYPAMLWLLAFSGIFGSRPSLVGINTREGYDEIVVEKTQ
jgi:hypothetical protein